MDNDKFNEVFSDPMYSQLVAEVIKEKNEVYDLEIEKFNEITNWIKKNNGKEPKKSIDLTERKLYARLKGYRERPELKKKFEEIDNLGLLKVTNEKLEEIAEESKEYNSLDDILKDESLFEETDKMKSLLDLSRYKRTINTADKYSRRKNVKDFRKFGEIFNLVQREIANGTRIIVPMDSEKSISEGKFYIDNGILLYVLSMSDYYIDKNGYRNAKLHLIYENGTENNGILLRSFASNLFDKTRNGKMVTEIISDVMGETNIEQRTCQYFTTGYIYVVKSLSLDAEIQKYENLYKIGFSRGNINERIKNAKDEATYLYAPVTVVATWEVQNINIQKLEQVLHNRFSENRLDIEIPKINGGTFNPKEWYIISLEDIEKEINDIIVKLNLL